MNETVSEKFACPAFIIGKNTSTFIDEAAKYWYHKQFDSWGPFY